MASRQASVPSSCGMLVYRLETSMVVSIAIGVRSGEGSPLCMKEWWVLGV